MNYYTQQQLIEVFQDTILIAKEIENTSSTQKYTQYTKDIEQGYEAKISVISVDTVSATRVYSLLGKTCVLNMASTTKAGGGVKNGRKAQEECLFRCSNLSQTVTQDYYPLDESEALYTQDAVFFKDKNYKQMSPILVDTVTIAAVNLSNGKKHHNYEKVMEDKIRLMLGLIANHGCKNIILGAWGCGVFKNDPENVAGFFKKVINEKIEGFSFRNAFKNIVFAIINDRNSVGDNYSVFKNCLIN